MQKKTISKTLEMRINGFEKQAKEVLESANIYEYLGFSHEKAKRIAEYMDSNLWLSDLKQLNSANAQELANGTLVYCSFNQDIFNILTLFLFTNSIYDEVEFSNVKKRYMELTGHQHNEVRFYAPLGYLGSGIALGDTFSFGDVYSNSYKRVQLAHGFGGEPKIFEDNLLGHILSRFVHSGREKGSIPDGIIMSVGALGSPGNTINLVDKSLEDSEMELAINADRHSMVLYLQGRMFGFNAKANKEKSNLADISGIECSPIIVGHSLGGAASLGLKIYFDKGYISKDGKKTLKTIAINPAFKVYGMDDPNTWYRSWQSFVINYIGPWGFPLLDRMGLKNLKRKIVGGILYSYDPTSPSMVLEKHTNVVLDDNTRLSQFNKVMGGAKEHYFTLLQLSKLQNNLTNIVCSVDDKMVNAYKIGAIAKKVKECINYVLLREKDGHYLKNPSNLNYVAELI